MKTITQLTMMGFCLLSFIYCSQKEYPVEIGSQDGVRQVKNPAFPRLAKNPFKLEEVLSIGLAEGDMNYLFHKVMGIDVDGDGNIYVLDTGNHRIQVFDQEGIYLTKMVLEEFPDLIKNGFAYAITKTEEGFNIVKKYKVEQVPLLSKANSR